MKKLASLASVLLLSQSVSIGVHGSGLISAIPHRQNSSFVLPIVKRDSLLNGLQLVTLEQPGTGSLSAHLRINSGAVFDLAGKGGLADITAGMLLKGGGGFSARNVADTVEQLGLTIAVTTGWDSTDIVVGGPPDSLDSMFDLLGRLVITPAFDPKELEALKAARIATLTKEGQADEVVVQRKALEAVFASYPFGRPARGTPESAAQITRLDLVYFHSRFYIANNAELLVSGDITADQVTRLARSKLGAWKKGEKILPTFKQPDKPAARRVVILDRSDGQPGYSAIAQIGVSRRAEDYFAAAIMADVLNQQASTAAAGHNGIAETILDARYLPGPLTVTIKSAAGSNDFNIARVVDVVLDTMTRMQSSLPASEAVESAKTRMIASMAERLKTTSGAADVILDIETYGLGRDYVLRFADRVNSITPADVQRAAQTYLKPQSVAISIAGSASQFENSMKKLGTVTVLK